MARALRIEYAGAWYHVMNRGAGRRLVFPNHELREIFLQLMEDIYDVYHCHCHAYCLMGNHYHLLIQTQLPNLGRAMRHLDGVYTQRHNRDLKTDGALFRGRYRAQLIERGHYLWSVSRYIHLNPRAAGLSQKLDDYKWSSFHYYSGNIVPPAWFQTFETVAQFGTAADYCRFVEGEAEKSNEEALMLESGGGQYPAVLGSTEFKAAALKYVSGDYEIPHSKPSTQSLSLDEIVETVILSMACTARDIYTPTNRLARERRAIALLMARQYGGFTLRALAEAFEIKSYTTVASAISRCQATAATDDVLAAKLDTVKRLILKMRNA